MPRGSRTLGSRHHFETRPCGELRKSVVAGLAIEAQRQSVDGRVAAESFSLAVEVRRQLVEQSEPTEADRLSPQDGGWRQKSLKKKSFGSAKTLFIKGSYFRRRKTLFMKGSSYEYQKTLFKKGCYSERPNPFGKGSYRERKGPFFKKGSNCERRRPFQKGGLF